MMINDLVTQQTYAVCITQKQPGFILLLSQGIIFITTNIHRPFSIKNFLK